MGGSWAGRGKLNLHCRDIACREAEVVDVVCTEGVLVSYSLKLICCRSEEALLGSPRGEPAVEIPLTAGVGKSGKLSLTTLT